LPTYGDEEFIYDIAAKNSQNQSDEIQNNIKNGYIIIDNKRINFSEREVIKDRLIMTIPSDFELMPQELAEFKYPSKNRPHIIFTDVEGEININFTLTTDKLENEGIEDAKEYLKQVIIKMNPSSRIKKNDVIEEDLRIGYFDYVSPAIDSDIYNLIFIFSLDKQLILGAFNSLHLDMAKWQEAAIQMVRSLRVIDGAKEG